MKSSRGFALTEVIIAAGIMGIILMAMTGLFQGQVRETRSLSEKLAALDFQRTITGAISIPNTCAKYLDATNLVSGAPLIFDPAMITSTDANNPTPVVTLKKIFGADGVSVLVDSNATDRLASPLSQSLQVRASNGVQLAAYKDPTSGQLNYSLQVAFDSSTLVRAIHNLNMPLNVTANILSATQTQISGCVGSSGGGANQGGALCGSRLVICNSGTPVYDQSCGPFACSMKATNTPCQGANLTVTCGTGPDPSGYGNYFVTGVQGCPQGYSGGHTMLNPSLSAGMGMMEAANIYCMKNP